MAVILLFGHNFYSLQATADFLATAEAHSMREMLFRRLYFEARLSSSVCVQLSDLLSHGGIPASYVVFLLFSVFLFLRMGRTL